MKVEETYLPEPGKYIYLKILVSYLDSPSKEVISANSKIKEQQETAHF